MENPATDRRHEELFPSPSTLTVLGTDDTSEIVSVVLSIVFFLLILLFLSVIIFVCVRRRVRRRQSYCYKELAVVKVHPPQTDSYVLNQGDEDSWSFEYVGEGNHVHFSQLVTRNGVAEIKYKHFV